MKKPEIGKAFRSSRSKYGGYSALVIIIVIVIVLVINMLAGQLGIKYDMTKNKLYSLSQQSYKIMDNLKQEVKIITFYKSGQENKAVYEILEKYSKRNNKIKLENIDPIVNPQLATKYSTEGTTVTTGFIVVESGGKFKAISPSDFYDYSTDYSTEEQSADSLVIEQKVTGALMYVINSKENTAYILQGHDEQALSSEVTTALSNENFPTKDLNLLTGQWSPKEGDLLIISSPTKDLNKEELKKLKDFFANGGRAVFLMDLTTDEMPNFKELMSTFGIEIQRDMVLEGDSSHAYQSPVYVIPELTSHEIVSPISSENLVILMPGAQPIKELPVKKASLNIEPLLTTTKSSWAKTNLDSKSVEKEKGDFNGPFNLAVAVTDTSSTGNTDKDAKVAVFSSSVFLSSDISSATNGGNLDLFMNSVNWVQDLRDNIAIAPKDLSSEVLTITDAQRLSVSALVTIIIPALVVGSGVTVWIRRRHR